MQLKAIPDQLCDIAIAPHSFPKPAVVYISSMAGLNRMPYLIKIGPDNSCEASPQRCRKLRRSA
jgi:hypothetical protein